MKRGVVPPLFLNEVEPGEAARQALQFIHPFTLEFDLDEQLNANIHSVCTQPDKVNQLRSQAMSYWEQQAIDLRDESILELKFPTTKLRAWANFSTSLSGEPWLMQDLARISTSSMECSMG